MASKKPRLIDDSEMLQGFNQFWMAQIEAAREKKSAFTAVADMCSSFYKKASGFMWEGKFKEKYLKDVEVPKFAVTLQKAFELVAIFGPYLYWQNPYRRVAVREAMEFPPELFADPSVPEQFWQMEYQLLAQQQQKHALDSEWRAILMERYLNYSQREQPGTLARAATFAINDALIKGRGCLWPEKYSFPGDDRVFTGIFYDSVDNLFIDPDCTDPDLKTAKWIARRHVNPYWEVERRFGLKEESLKGKGGAESPTHAVQDAGLRGRKKREDNGGTNDLVVWYEIFSKMGAGTRDSSWGKEYSLALHDAMEEYVGDFAYLCVTDSLNHPLNLTPEDVDADVEEVAERMSWPCPAYIDHRWPVALLDFYPDHEGCWPIAPLGPALGELIAMNVILSAFLENAYENRKTIIACAEHAVEQLESAMKSTQTTEYIKLRSDLKESVSSMIQILKRPEMNNDPLKALDYLAMSFDKRTGLSENMYAMSSTQSRSATDARAKDEKSAIRPEKMSKDVAATISEASQLEKLIAVIELSGENLTSLLGPMGASLWDRLIASQDIIEVSREMTATVEASDIRKPNKARDTENVQSAAGFIAPILQTYASVTGDSEPLNSFIKSFGDAIEMSTTEWTMRPWVPEMPEEAKQQQQVAMQMEMGEKQADIEKTQAETQKIYSEIGASSESMQAEAAMRQQEFNFKELEAQQNMSHKQAETASKLQQSDAAHKQKLTQEQIKFMQDVRNKAYQNQIRMEQFRQEGAIRNQRKQGVPQ